MKLHKCKCHGRVYHRCWNCKCEFCTDYWPACPRCHTRPTIWNWNNRPLAAPGLTSYRYRNGAFGFVMIGAKDHSDALREAARSITGEPSRDRLEIWNGAQYVAAYDPACD